MHAAFRASCSFTKRSHVLPLGKGEMLEEVRLVPMCKSRQDPLVSKRAQASSTYAGHLLYRSAFSPHQGTTARSSLQGCLRKTNSMLGNTDRETSEILQVRSQTTMIKYHKEVNFWVPQCIEKLCLQYTVVHSVCNSIMPKKLYIP